MLELLSPAGSMEALRAAVQNGADAVYLGYDAFNARMNARNFSAEELQEAVVYCHVRGVKVHLTLNTLISDREMAHAAEIIRLAAALGIDAIIVQDLGVARLCRQIAPDMPIHASTQMSIHSLEGVAEAASLGCSRVVLARELSRSEIAYICRRSPVEIEVFAHGALCMCYSGQCYLSSVIGRRSGNRGQCAQPCRLAYGYGRYEPMRYPLSLKDNCLIEYVDELEKMGVASIKLEGRMKRAEYVAVVTRAYRAALDGEPITQQSLQELETAFSRQGFTQGYYLGKKGADMFGVRQETEDTRELFAAARATYENTERPLVPVKFYAMLHADAPAQLAVEDRQGHICRAEGPVPQKALTHSLTQEELTERLGKTGGTPFLCEDVRSRLEPGLMLPASALNAMRRDVLSQLTAVRGRVPAAKLHPYAPVTPYDGEIGTPRMSVCVRSVQQLTPTLLAAKPAVIYVPMSEILGNAEFITSLPVETQIAAVLPRVSWTGESPRLARQLKELYALGVRQLLVGNLGQIGIARAAGFDIRGDFGLNAYNSRTIHYLHAEGLLSQLLSFEMTLPQIRDLSKPMQTEVMVYGRLPLMLMENCVIHARTGACACDSAPTRLVDRMGEEFAVVRDQDTCRNVLLNGKKLYLLDRLQSFHGLGLWALRLQFTTENAGEVDKLVQEYRRGGVFDAGSCTRGLYTRGVE